MQYTSQFIKYVTWTNASFFLSKRHNIWQFSNTQHTNIYHPSFRSLCLNLYLQYIEQILPNIRSYCTSIMCYMLMFTRLYTNSPKLSTILYELHVVMIVFTMSTRQILPKLPIILRVFHVYKTLHILPKLSINGSHVLYDHIYKILYKNFDHTVRVACCHYYIYKTPCKFS